MRCERGCLLPATQLLADAAAAVPGCCLLQQTSQRQRRTALARLRAPPAQPRARLQTAQRAASCELLPGAARAGLRHADACRPCVGVGLTPCCLRAAGRIPTDATAPPSGCLPLSANPKLNPSCLHASTGPGGQPHCLLACAAREPGMDRQSGPASTAAAAPAAAAGDCCSS